MTEAEWLVSTDPQAMLRIMEGGSIPLHLFSSRKMRLWCAALYDMSGHDYLAAQKTLIRWREGAALLNEAKSTMFAASNRWGDPKYDNNGDPPMAPRAALLRDVVGNPFRPVKCKQTGNPLGTDTVMVRGDGSLAGCDCAWLTSTILSLAKAAYDERQPDGTLDAFRLALVADALEEAGCDSKALLCHLRGMVPCACQEGKRDCQVDAGYGNSLMTTNGWQWCYVCNEGGRGACPGWRVPREPVMHARGCHVLDTILGLS